MKFKMPNMAGFGQGSDGPPPVPGSRNTPPAPRMGMAGRLVSLFVAAVAIYGIYFWEYRRVVVGPNEVLVLIKKDGSRSLPGDGIIVPAAPSKPARAADMSDADFAKATADWQQGQNQWDKQYGDCNGIMEKVYPVGVYFGFSPWDYERQVIDISSTAIVPNGKVGVVVKKFGNKLDAPKFDSRLEPGQVLADIKRDQRGVLPILLNPGTYYQYANPYAYDILQVNPVNIAPGERGVVTVMAGQAAANPDQYLVSKGEQGVQQDLEPEGFRYLNPFEKRVTPISIRSQQFKLVGDDLIRFPSADSFDIQLEGFVEWSIIPKRLPEIYVQYGEGGELIPLLQERVILPYARSFCRIVGSQYLARDFISGETREKFQAEFRRRLSEACEKQGIEILQAVVSNIEPPQAIKDPIKDRATAKQQILQFQQQILVADSQAKLATQTEMAVQNQAIGEANSLAVQTTKKAEKERDVAITLANQQLAVAQKQLEAAKAQAEAIMSMGQADANVIFLQRQAEAAPLKQQVDAFGGGDGYARYYFYQKVAPSVKSILTNTDGPFADIFKQFTTPPGSTQPAPLKTAGGQP